MEPFKHLKAVAAPIEGAGVNTDQIFPARFLRKPRSVGYAQFAFHDIRRDSDGNFRDDFPLNQDKFKGAKILVAGTNFGIGSSREGAVYTMVDGGVRAVIANSFGDIYAANCLKNGVLVIRLAPEITSALRAQLMEVDKPELDIDLEKQIVTTPDGKEIPFEIDDFQKHCLLKGLNEIDLSLEFSDDMDAFEASYRKSSPWLAREGATK